MKLLQLTVKNYRVHRETTVVFDGARNLIGGPNESGKSTLVEAAHRVLFLRARTGGTFQKEMISSRHSGDPEVTLRFDACGSQWEIYKRFGGASRGSAKLTASDGAVFRDDQAEAKLAEILKCDFNSGRVAAAHLQSLWSHLWVWQGRSGDDPTAHASQQKDQLLQRLQHDGVSAVMQSEMDRQVRIAVDARAAELFTPQGRPRAGSAPEIARLAMEAAGEALEAAQSAADRLAAASAAYEAADREMEAATLALPTLRELRQQTEMALAKVAELRRLEESEAQALQAARLKRESLAEANSRIRQLQAEAASARAALEPAAATEATFAAAAKSARESMDRAEFLHREASASSRLARLRHDFAAAALAVMEKRAMHRELAARSAEADRLRSEISTSREALETLPQLGAGELKSLRSADHDVAHAAATLEAMATGIELVRAELPVWLDGQTLERGHTRVLTDTGELQVGDGAVIRIRPGGGASLAEARDRKHTADQKLSAMLERHAVRDLDHAAEVVEMRQSLGQDIANLETRWKAMGGESLAAQLTLATTALHAAQAEVDRRAAAAEFADPVPESLEKAMQVLAATREALTEAERAEIQAATEVASQRKRWESAERALLMHREQFASATQAQRDRELRIKVLEETHGEVARRESHLADAREAEESAAARLARTRTALAALAPENLNADLERFARSIAAQEDLRRNAELRRATARVQLTLDGSSDPQADLEHARAKFETASELHATEARRAAAIALLHRLFTEAREAIDRNLSQPLADRINAYLQCLFGSSTTLTVRVSEGGIEGLELVRADDSAFGFATLSGGAREQVAAAVRLAMAEILAADHDGCLPVVFDDAFAFSDPQRIQALQRMLDYAARQGLQIILLTCTPGDYAGLGAAQIRLP